MKYRVSDGVESDVYTLHELAEFLREELGMAGTALIRLNAGEILVLNQGITVQAITESA